MKASEDRRRRDAVGRVEQIAPESTRGPSRCGSSPLVGEDQGGGSRCPKRQETGGASDNLLGSRDPPPLPAPARGGGCANGLAFAFSLLALFCSPARADFRVCNKTHALINIAVGTDAGEVFKTEGWWVATPGSCATPIRGPLKSRYVYLYATDIDGVDLLAGTATMCIDRGKFTAYGVENCWRRGLQAVTFAEIDTLDSSDWTTFLTDPRR